MIETRFSYEIKFNGSNIDVTQGTVLVEKLQEPLDEGAINVPITVKDIEYEMFGFLQIKIIGLTSSKDFTFFIQEDEIVTATKDGIYTHQLTLIEYTYAYDTKLVKALTFTQNLQNNRKATFFVNLPSTTSNYNYAIKDYWLPPIDLKEMNVTNKELVVPKCEKAYQNDGGSGYFRRDVFIRIYTPNNVVYNVSQRRYVSNGAYDKETILSNEDFTFTATEEGVHLIEYGIVNLFDGEKAIPRAVVFTFTLNFFNEQIYTLYDYVERIKRVVPLESRMYHGQTRLFNLDPSLVERFKQIKMPQIFITQMTLRQTLNTLFKFINAILKLEYVEDGLDNLTIHEFNKVIGSFDLEKMVDFKTSQNIQGYGTTITSWLENAMQTNFRETPTVKTPANNYYKTVRAKNVQLTENQNGFILPLDGGTIYEINKLSVVIPKITYGGYSSGSATPLTVKTFYEIDLTDRTLPIDAWEIKNITNDFPAYEVQPMFSQRVGMRENKGGNIYYERGKDYIDFSKEFGTWFSEVLIMQVIKEALAEYFTINNPLAFLSYGPIDERTGFVVDNIDQNWFYRNIGFNVEYTTLKSVTVKNHRNYISHIYKNTEIRLNQNARITDFNLATRNAVGYLERMGVPNKDFSRVHTSLDDLLKIGMQDKDGYVITKATYELNNDYIVGNYEVTKDHIRLSEFMGIDRAFRAFAVPNNSQVYDRDEQYEDFIMVAPIDSDLNAETTMFNNQFINKCFKTITSNEKLQNKISFAFVRTDGFSKIYRDEVNMYKAIMTPVSSYGGEQVLLFTFGFKSNLVAGDAIYKKGSNYFNDPIRYTDQLGRFEELWFAMADYYTETTPFDPIGSSDETTFNKTYSYPLVQSPNNRFNQNFLISTGDIDNSTYNPIIFSKDPSEVLRSMNYQVNILSLNYTQYIIGSKFFTDNRLVLNNEDVEKLYLYKYKDGTRYDVFETLLAKVDSNLYDYDVVELNRSLAFNNIIYLEYANGTSVVRFTNNAIIRSEHTSWAIANEQCELYFACNENENGFRLVPRHFRPDIQDLRTMNDSNYIVELSDTLFISVQMNIEQFVFPQVALNDTLALNVSFDIQTSTDNVLEINDTLQLSCGLTVTKFETPTLILNDSLSLASSLTILKSTDFILPVLNDELELNVSFDIEKSTDFVLPTLSDTLSLNSSFAVSKSTDFAVPTLNDTLSLNVSMTIQKEEKVWTYIGTTSATYNNIVDLYNPQGCPTQAQAKAFLDEEYPATNFASGYIMRVARRVIGGTCTPATYYFRVDIITT